MVTRVSLETMADGRIAVIKTALTGDRQDRLAEAAWLAEARHRGVVRLLNVTKDPPTIRTLHAGSTTLRTANPSPAQAARLFTDAFVTMADLHDRGITHGEITLDHLIVKDNRVLFCSPSGLPHEPCDDLSALGRCMDTMLERWKQADVTVALLADWQRLSVLLQGEKAQFSARRAAREFARISQGSRPLGRAATHADNTDKPTLRVPSEIAIDGPTRPSRGLVLGALLAVAAIAGVWLVTPTSASTAAQGPTVIVGTSRYQITGTGSDHASVVAENCPNSGAVVFLNTQTDSLWLFATPQADAVPLAVVPGASALATGDSCDQVWVEGPAGRAPVTLDSER